MGTAMEPSHILRCVADKYARCLSYSDCGIVDFDDVEGKKEQLEFRTHFIRPKYFCFEWQDYGPRRGKSTDFSMLWSMSGETLTRYQWGIEDKDNLHLAVCGATGCSAGAANLVPSLLVEEIREGSNHLLRLADLKLLRNEKMNEQDCYVLQGTLHKSGDHILWISAEDFVVLRVYVDMSRTAEESEKEHNELLANSELMAQLEEMGIAPPTEMNHKDTSLVAQYTYADVRFDEPILPLADPRL